MRSTDVRCWLLVPLCLMVAACLESATFVCNDTLCGAGTVCTPSGCATEAEAAACLGKPDGTTCEVLGTGRGACIGQACRASICGDGIVAFGEACDDGNAISGDGCAANCASTEACGNGILDPGEACDDGNVVNGDTCHADCSVPRCGDQIVDTRFGEVCDDGNLIDGDGCAANCASSELCGNGLIDAHVGEACDDGNLLDGDACQHTCQLPRCGDGITDTRFAEACDDGNLLNGDGCAANCRSDETCGNGFIDVGLGEQCDDGVNNTDAPNGACRMNCKVRRCGDGIVDYGTAPTDPKEACDDGNNVDTDGCAADCHSDEQCGNGLVDYSVGEQCDGGVPGLSGDGCASTCEAEVDGWEDRSWHDSPGCLSEQVCVVQNLADGRAYLFDGTRLWYLDTLGWHTLDDGGTGPVRLAFAAVAATPQGEIIIFGGKDDENVVQPWLWRYRNGSWQQESLDGDGPGGRSDAQLTYDTTNDRLLLVGGIDENGEERFDTWEYTSGGWRELP